MHAYSFSRLRRQLPLGGSLSYNTFCVDFLFTFYLSVEPLLNHATIAWISSYKQRENPRRGFSLFLCSAKKFTLSCVLRTIKVFRPLRRAPQGSALITCKFFEKNLTKNFHTLVCANIVRTTVERTMYAKTLPSVKFLALPFFKKVAKKSPNTN